MKFDIYFDLDSSKFSAVANQAILALFDYLSGLNGDYRILLVGNADRVGKKLYNDRIARERVIATQDKLIKNGVPERLIEIKSMGELSDAIITKDERQSKYNRRVSVYVLEGSDALSPIPLPLIENYIYKEEILEEKKKRRIE